MLTPKHGPAPGLKVDLSPQASAELAAAVDAANGQPVHVTDPQSNRTFIIQCVEMESKERGPASDGDEVPEGIRAAQKAFWNALPALLNDRKFRGKWVVFGPERLVRASDCAADLYVLLEADSQRRYIARVEPLEQPPWEPELVLVPDRASAEESEDER